MIYYFFSENTTTHSNTYELYYGIRSYVVDATLYVLSKALLRASITVLQIVVGIDRDL